MKLPSDYRYQKCRNWVLAFQDFCKACDCWMNCSHISLWNIKLSTQSGDCISYCCACPALIVSKYSAAKADASMSTLKGRKLESAIKVCHFGSEMALSRFRLDIAANINELDNPYLKLQNCVAISKHLAPRVSSLSLGDCDAFLYTAPRTFPRTQTWGIKSFTDCIHLHACEQLDAVISPLQLPDCAHCQLVLMLLWAMISSKLRLPLVPAQRQNLVQLKFDLNDLYHADNALTPHCVELHKTVL